MISGIVLVKNQEEQLKKCLASISFCEEIIVIDDYSVDASVKVAEKAGARVYKRKLDGDFASQRNFGLEKAKNEWVFFVDADEVVSEQLATELYQLTSQFLTSISGYYIKRVDFLWGRRLTHGDSGSTKLLRLAKKSQGKWEGKVHETWTVLGEKGILSYPLYHYPHQSIREFLKEINFYTTLRAKELYSQKKKVNAFSIAAYPLGKFILLYLIKLGFLDGIPGMISALMMSFHSFLVRGKLWQLQQKKQTYDFGN